MKEINIHVLVLIACLLGMGGFMLIFFGFIMKMIRTRSIFSWQLLNQEDALEERRLGYYGVLMVLAAFAFGVIAAFLSY